MRFNPHLTFDGQCEQAFRFYEKCLGGQITFLLPYGESPLADPAHPELQTKILHATLTVGDFVLTGTDEMPGRYERPRGISILLHLEDQSEADRIFAAFAEGGAVHMPLQETFWAARFGMVADRFGTPWFVNCAKPPVS